MEREREREISAKSNRNNDANPEFRKKDRYFRLNVVLLYCSW